MNLNYWISYNTVWTPTLSIRILGAREQNKYIFITLERDELINQIDRQVCR